MINCLIIGLAPAYQCQPSLMRSRLSGLCSVSFACRQKQHPNLFLLIAITSLHLQSAFHPTRSHRPRIRAGPCNLAFSQLRGGWGSGVGGIPSNLDHIISLRRKKKEKQKGSVYKVEIWLHFMKISCSQQRLRATSMVTAALAAAGHAALLLLGQPSPQP